MNALKKVLKEEREKMVEVKKMNEEKRNEIDDEVAPPKSSYRK
jgi:hypothetical protein